MAVKNYTLGQDYPIYIDTTTPITAAAPAALTSPNWRMVMCLASNALNVTIGGVDVTNKCTNGWADSLSTDGSWEVSADGQVVALEEGDEATQINSEEILEKTVDKVAVWAAIFDPDKKSVRAGVVRFSAFGETQNTNEAYSFSTTMTGKGKLFTTRDFVPAG